MRNHCCPTPLLQITLVDAFTQKRQVGQTWILVTGSTRSSLPASFCVFEVPFQIVSGDELAAQL